MEVHQLRYFCAVARHGTFTRASEVEHVAQPSLSQQILKLEAELGARLFDRLPRAAKLTVFGKAFLPKAERILHDLEQAKTEVLEMSGHEKGELVIGVIPTVAPYLLPKLLLDFTGSRLGVSIKIVEDVTAALVEQLHAGSVDLAILALPVPGELASRELFEEPFFAALPESHPRAAQESMTLAELRGEPFLLLKEEHC